MPVSVQCQCGQRYRVRDSAVGKKVKCKQCGAVIPVRPKKGIQTTPQKKTAQDVPSSSDPDGEGFLDFDLSEFQDAPAPAVPARQADGAVRDHQKNHQAETSRLPNWAKTESVEDRIRKRSEETHEAEFRRQRIVSVVVGAATIGLAILVFWGLHAFEQRGGIVRVPLWVALLYRYAGKWGVSLAVGGFGVLRLFAGLFGVAIDDDE